MRGVPGVVQNGPMDEHASAPSTGTLRRSVSLGQLIFFGLVFMGPAAAVGIFGTLDAKSSGAVATVYIIATLVMAFTALSYMRMSREVPRAVRSLPTRGRASARGLDTFPAG